MKTDPLMLFYGWLRSTLPCDTETILCELEIGHRSVPEAYADFPHTSEQLMQAMSDLAIKGLVEDVSGQWIWRSGEQVKAEPTLF